MDKPDLLMKAKALAAVEHGVWLVHKEIVGNGYYPVRWIKGEPYPVRVAGDFFTYWPTPTEALAAAADALGLSPDPAVVVLTEEEKATVNDALLYYRNIALEHAADQERRGYVESAEAWRRTAEQAESLRQRLAE